jgi:hypothetical protein
MPEWLMIAFGVALGLSLVVAALGFAVASAGRLKRKARGGHSVSREDRGPSVGTSNDPISGD